MRAFNVYCQNPKNVGDMNCGPHQFFPFPFQVGTLNIWDDPTPIDGHCIFGGGGLTHFDHFGDWIVSCRGKRIGWAFGHNRHASRIEWPAYMSLFDLVGVRDWRAPYPWVPCVSAMSPLFDQPYRITQEAVVFDHQHNPTGVTDLPTMRNDVPTMAQVIEFMGSAQTVITSSYHGVYWATLLARKVVLVNGRSTRFRSFRHPPVVATKQMWREAVKGARVYTEALGECRQANTDFHAKVVDLIGG